jgi:hypothetical protein
MNPEGRPVAIIDGRFRMGLAITKEAVETKNAAPSTLAMTLPQATKQSLILLRRM